MFERFTDRARRVVVLAQEEARMLNHDWIGTEHILLGLIHEAEGVAAKALESLGVSLEKVRSQVEEIIGEGKSPPSGHIPFTPRAKKVLEYSLREALLLSHNYIGPEHILLGLIREGEGVAAQVLFRLGADLNSVRQQVITLLAEGVPTSSPVESPRPPLSPEIAQLDEEIAALRSQKEEAIDAKDFERAARLRDREKELQLKKTGMMRELKEKLRATHGERVALSREERGTAQVGFQGSGSPPVCPGCSAALSENVAYRILEVTEADGEGRRKVLFVFCRSCGITIDDQILPEGS